MINSFTWLVSAIFVLLFLLIYVGLLAGIISHVAEEIRQTIRLELLNTMKDFLKFKESEDNELPVQNN